MCHSWLAWSLTSPTGIGTSWQWCMYVLFVWSLSIFVSPTVPFRDITAKGVDSPQCLGVVHKLMYTWILICAPSLSLVAEDFSSGSYIILLLKNTFTSRIVGTHSTTSMNQLNERVGWRKRVLYISINRHKNIHHDILVISLHGISVQRRGGIAIMWGGHTQKRS